MFFPFMNLLFMHYYFYVNNFIEWTWLYSKVINLCAITFDVSVMFLLCLLVVKRNMKLALLMIQVVTLAWAFVNVVYGRFFFQYLPLSVIQETSGLGNSLVINSILPEFHWYDSYFIFTSICFFLIYKKTTDRRIDIKVMVRDTSYVCRHFYCGIFRISFCSPPLSKQQRPVFFSYKRIAL